MDSDGPIYGFLADWPTALAIGPTPVVDDMVSLTVATTAMEPAPNDEDARAARAGVFRITAILTNLNTAPIRRPFFRVAELSDGNLLISRDRPTDTLDVIGTGARQTPDLGTDGMLSPGESVEVSFAIGLRHREPFTFLIGCGRGLVAHGNTTASPSSWMIWLCGSELMRILRTDLELA
jgi:hypothetical protein